MFSHTPRRIVHCIDTCSNTEASRPHYAWFRPTHTHNATVHITGKCVSASLTHIHTHACALVVPGDQTGGSNLLLEQVGGEERNVRDGRRKTGGETVFCLVT